MATLEFPDTFLPDGNAVGGSVIGWPLDGPITQRFAQISVTGARHGGMDIAANTGAYVFAPAPGIVREVWPESAGRQFGNYVVVDHQDTPYYTAYAHLSAVYVVAGEILREGDTIGRVGNTGLSYGSHLHWAVSEDPGFSLNFAYLSDPAHYIVEEESMAMSPEEKAQLELVRNVLWRWGIPGIPYASVIHLFPSGTQPVEEGSTGPLVVLTGDSAEAYVQARGFSFGMALLEHLYHHPGPSPEDATIVMAIGADGDTIDPPVGDSTTVFQHAASEHPNEPGATG